MLYLLGEKVRKKAWANKSQIPKLQIRISQEATETANRNAQSLPFAICGRSENLTNYLLIPQICGFAICGTNLRTAHLCLVQIFCLPVCPVACGVKLAAATLEIAVDGGGVGRVLDVVPHLVVVRQ
jgi:hypothetical protein